MGPGELVIICIHLGDFSLTYFHSVGLDGLTVKISLKGVACTSLLLFGPMQGWCLDEGTKMLQMPQASAILGFKAPKMILKGEIWIHFVLISWFIHN